MTLGSEQYPPDEALLNDFGTVPAQLLQRDTFAYLAAVSPFWIKQLALMAREYREIADEVARDKGFPEARRNPFEEFFTEAIHSLPSQVPEYLPTLRSRIRFLQKARAVKPTKTETCLLAMAVPLYQEFGSASGQENVELVIRYWEPHKLCLIQPRTDEDERMRSVGIASNFQCFEFNEARIMRRLRSLNIDPDWALFWRELPYRLPNEWHEITLGEREHAGDHESSICVFWAILKRIGTPETVKAMATLPHPITEMLDFSTCMKIARRAYPVDLDVQVRIGKAGYADPDFPTSYLGGHEEIEPRR